MKMNKHLSKLMAMLLALGMSSTSFVSGNYTVYAKEIGKKNEKKQEDCEVILSGLTPKDSSGEDYEDILGNGSVYRGGNARSGVTEGGKHYLDNDPNDFANALPYGNVFVDTTKLKWNTPANFIIDIKDDRFKWIATGDVVLEDAVGHTSINNPLGSEKTLKGERTSSGIVDSQSIAYVGELKPYHNDIKAVPDGNADNTNIIEAPAGDYLYRITYLNAATLADGTRGNVVITMTKVEFETSINVDENNPHVLTDENDNTYQYTKAVVPIQGPNDLIISGNLVDSEGNFVNKPNIVVKTKEEVDAAIAAARAAGGNIPDNYSDDKVIRNTIGGAYTFDIQVQDSEGNAAVGTMAYAANDLDLPSYQTNWGRERGSDPFMFAEGLSILSGTQSYALVPKYNHNEATTLEDGWVPDGISGSLDSALSITGGSNSGNADGVRFASIGEKVMRDKNGKWDDVLFSGPVTNQGKLMNQPTGTIMDFTWDNINNSRVRYKNPDDVWNTYINSTTYKATNIRRELAGKIYRNGTVVPWNQITIQEIIDYFEGGSYSIDRDDWGTYDSGFAVLINPGRTRFRWTASTPQSGKVGTNLFDSTIFTYAEATHGTGGGIYFETYDFTSRTCNPVMNEGTITMGRGESITTTAVPEDGYRVSRILIGDTNYGHGSNVSGLRDYTTYFIDGNDIKDASGTVLGTFAGSGKVRGFDELKTGSVTLTGFNYDKDGVKVVDNVGSFTFERNADGSVDVTLPNIDNPMHVHVDFDADYYFYKVWVGDQTEELNITVAPYDFYPTEVTIPVPTGEVSPEGIALTEDVLFTINGTKYTAKNGTYANKVFTLNANNMIEYVEVDSEGQEILAVRPSVILVGNDFVHYTYDETAGEYVIDERYPVTIEEKIANWDSSDAKSFKVNDTSTYTDNGYVTVLDESNTISPGNIVWKIKYPSEGVTALGWPKLPVEKEPANPNHDALNHVNRNYWFAIEETLTWANASYNNENALIPGVLPSDSYKETKWGKDAIKDYDKAKKLVHETNKDGSAFLSVFENGGEIKNVPSVIVRGRKVWVDEDNKYNNRTDIWLHIDATVHNADGSVTNYADVLPAQKVAKDATGNDLMKTWGNRTTYDTEEPTIQIVESLKSIPSNAKRQINGSYLAGNTYYWINELKKYDANRATYEYSIRETLDREGNQPVVKDSADAGLLGYTSDDSASWDELVKDTTTISGKEVDRYTGDVTNTLKKITYEATKVWDDNKNQDGYREDITFVLEGLDTLPDGQEKEKVISADNDTTTVTWTNLPKYKDGKLIQYNVLEEGLNQQYYSLSYHSEQDSDGNFKDTFTNTHIPETASISIFKKWDDENNQDNLRKEAAKVLLEGKTDSEAQYRSVVDQDGQGITQGLVPVEDGLVITWLNIPVKRNGEPITYKIYEDINGLGGYYTDPTYVEETFTLTNGENKEAAITNKETPELTEVTITKEWDDMDNHDGIRPDSITVQLVKTYQKLKETTKTVKKQVTVNGEKYDVKVATDGTEYFEIDGQYYRGDEIKEVDGDVTNYEHLIPFNPDDTGEVLQEEKTVEVDGELYSVRVTTEGMEYYVKDGTSYYSPEGDELAPGEEGFYPTPEDEIVYEDLVIEIDGTEYKVKTGKLDGEEQWYYEKDGQYFDIFNNELIKFVPSDSDAVVQIEVEGEPEYEEAVEKTDVELTEAMNWTTTITDLNVNEPVGQKVTYSVEEENVPEGYSVTITSTEAGKFTVKNKHEVIINPPTANPDETINYKGRKQTGTPTFQADPDTKAPGGGENKIERITLLDEDGNEVNTVTVPGEGTYVLNEDGTITFTPEPEFVGKTSGVKVRGYDSNNLYADTTYTPTVIVKVSYVDPLKGETVQGPEDSSVPGGKDITTTYEDTPGEESKNHPGYRFDGWGETIDPDDPSHYIRTAKYTPLHYIEYDPNGGTGDMDEDVYDADEPEKSHKRNTFTRRGYTFIGFKAYITDPETGKETPIVDGDGNPIIFQDTNDMAKYFEGKPGGTRIRMEAQWKRHTYHIHYDANGGTGTMTSQDFTGDDTSAVSKENTFTRNGYRFRGFLAVTKDGRELGVFQSPEDFLKYLEEQGDGGEVTLIALWRPLSESINPTPAETSSVKVSIPNTKDGFHIGTHLAMLVGALVVVILLENLKKKN